MNMNHSFENFGFGNPPSFFAACKGACRKLLTRLQNTKNAVLSEFRQSTFNHERLLHLALNEAEALAYETGVPYLTFPLLAREKAQAVADWGRKQSRVRRESFHRLAA
jgi:hypothetical protein